MTGGGGAVLYVVVSKCIYLPAINSEIMQEIFKRGDIQNNILARDEELNKIILMCERLQTSTSSSAIGERPRCRVR